MANFDELIPKVTNWDVEEEELLINKIKAFTEDYQQKCSDLSLNLNNINRNLHLIEVDFFNSLNGLKSLSGSKFIEHVIDAEDQKPEEEKTEEVQPPIEENVKDEHFNNVNNILQRSFDFLAVRDQQKNQAKNNNNNNNQEDDTMSMNSKIMDNNITKNNRGLKLPFTIGSNDFYQNDYIGLVNDDDEDEEDFNNEIKNEIPLPPEGGPGEVPVNNDENNNNINNNPEQFHNMIQQNMGGPVRNQSMFDEENKENEKEFINPALAMEVDEGEETGLGGLLRKSSIKPNNNNINMNNPMAQRNMSISSIASGKGQIKLTNFLGANFFGDDDDEDDNTGLFSRPRGMTRPMPNMQNNLSLDNNNNNLMMNNQNLINQQNVNLNQQLLAENNNNNNMSWLNNQNNNQNQISKYLNKMQMQNYLLIKECKWFLIHYY